MMNEELETTFIVLQTMWDFWILCCFAFFISVTISYLATYVWTEEQILDFLNKK